jgi:hypothetical protein
MNFEQIRQAQALKSKLDKVQKELKRMQIEGEAGKGAVTVVVNGEQKNHVGENFHGSCRPEEYETAGTADNQSGQ